MKEHKWNVRSAICKSLSFFCLHSLYACQTLPIFPCFLTHDLYFWCSPLSLQSSLCCLVHSVLSCLLTLQFPYCRSYLAFFYPLLCIFMCCFFILCSFPFLVLSLMDSCSYSRSILRGSSPQQDVWDWRARSCKHWGLLAGPFPLSSVFKSKQLLPNLRVFPFSSFFPHFLPGPLLSPAPSPPHQLAQSSPVPQHIPYRSFPCRTHGSFLTWLARRTSLHGGWPSFVSFCLIMWTPSCVCPLHYQNTRSSLK